jgi:hypothetical protein
MQLSPHGLLSPPQCLQQAPPVLVPLPDDVLVARTMMGMAMEELSPWESVAVQPRVSASPEAGAVQVMAPFEADEKAPPGAVHSMRMVSPGFRSLAVAWRVTVLPARTSEGCAVRDVRMGASSCVVVDAVRSSRVMKTRVFSPLLSATPAACPV